VETTLVVVVNVEIYRRVYGVYLAGYLSVACGILHYYDD
jgi:hypothetical protein